MQLSRSVFKKINEIIALVECFIHYGSSWLVELRLPRSGVSGPRFANIEWTLVTTEARGSQPITQQRQRKASTTFRGCPSLYVNIE